MQLYILLTTESFILSDIVPNEQVTVENNSVFTKPTPTANCENWASLSNTVALRPWREC